MQDESEITLDLTIPGITGDDYHAAIGISSSQLKAMGVSPAHYYGTYLDPDMPPKKRNPNFAFGTMVHTMVLEPDTFDDDYIVTPVDTPDRRTKAGKEWWHQFEGEAQAKEIVKAENYQLAVNIRDAVFRHDAAAALLDADDAEMEISGWWKDPTTGQLLKYRPDCRTPRAIVDLKTTAGSVDYDTVQRSIWNYNYHTSAAHYLDGDMQCRGSEHDTFVLVFVSKEWPHEVGVYYLDADAIELGRRQNRAWLRQLHHCLETNRWPQVNDGQITEIGLPAYAIKKLG